MVAATQWRWGGGCWGGPGRLGPPEGGSNTSLSHSVSPVTPPTPGPRCRRPRPWLCPGGSASSCCWRWGGPAPPSPSPRSVSGAGEGGGLARGGGVACTRAACTRAACAFARGPLARSPPRTRILCTLASPSHKDSLHARPPPCTRTLCPPGLHDRSRGPHGLARLGGAPLAHRCVSPPLCSPGTVQMVCTSVSLGGPWGVLGGSGVAGGESGGASGWL